MRYSKLMCCSALASSVLFAAPVLAQTTDEPTAVEGDSTQLGEIVVTAEKRPSVAQKTAISLAVIDAETLSENGVGDLKDLTTIAPSVSYAQVNGSAIIGIRGVSSRTTSDPAVSTSMDGFYTQVPNGLNGTVFDLERVEILRGPQGTLLGRNATGGAVNFISAKPKADFEASASAEVGSYDMFNTTGMVNIPLSDVVQLRAAFQTRDRDGYRKNPVGEAGDDEHSRAARVHLSTQFNDRWSGLLTAEYTSQDNVGPVTQGVPLVYTTGTTVSTAMPTIPGDGKTIAVPAGAHMDSETIGLRWNTTYDLDFAQLTYLGGYRHLDYQRLSTLGGAYGTVAQNLSQFSTNEADTWNHELRLTSALDGPLFWQVGAFHFNETNDDYTTLSDFRGATNLYGTRTDLYIYNYPGDLIRSSAVFGQASYALTDKLKLEGGARYTWDHKERDGSIALTSIGAYLSTGAVNLTTTPQTLDYSSDQATYHAGLNWQFTPVNMLYAKFDTGYKAGGFNELTTFDPETVTSYEVGSKNRFLDNRLQFNAAAYYYDYKNQQVTQYVPDMATNAIVNAGQSRYYGVELDLLANLTPSDQVSAYVAWSDAEYTDFATAIGSTNVQLAGNTPPQAPEWSINLGYEHDFALPTGVLTLRAQSHYETSSYFTVYNYDYDKQDAYTRSDLIATYRPDAGSWKVEAFVRNIEDETVLAYAQTASSTYRSYRYLYQAPRTFGVKVSVDW